MTVRMAGTMRGKCDVGFVAAVSSLGRGMLAIVRWLVEVRSQASSRNHPSAQFTSSVKVAGRGW